MLELTTEQMVTAMRDNDKSYDGRFWVGVKSTGIYCLPSCPAKTPLIRNVEFYATREEAVAAGFRACKRCRPNMFPDTQPEWLDKVLALMREEVNCKLNESKLSEIARVDISTIRRHFNQYLSMTPLAFHRKLRLEYARRMILKGADYLTAAYECGFESSSGFRDAFRKQFGMPPGRYYGG